jgi:AraC family transcriptional regulator
MVTIIQRHSPRPPEFTPVQQGHNLAVERVISTMRDDVSYPYTLDTFAEIANYSPYHFARMFRSVVGVPPGEFLAALRFEQAKHLILHTDASITEICMEVGFASLGTFSARFKQLVGRSPAELRELPEALSDRLPQLTPCLGQRQVRTGGQTLHGTILSTAPRKGHLFVGLFPSAIPQAAPVAGTLVGGPGPFRVANVPQGTYRILAAQFPFGVDPLVHLLPDASLLVGSDLRPITVAAGTPPRLARVELRPRVPTDPPILTVLAPSLLGL